MRKSLLAFLMLAATAAAFPASATSSGAATGEWNVYPLYSSRLDKIVETPSGKVWYISGSSLYSYDPGSEELYSYTTRNLLNGTSVADILYNKERGYLLVVYDDSNLDLIYDDGRVVNIPDIREAQISHSKTVNHVWLDPTGIYIATGFGIVVIDDVRHEVRESGIYGCNVEYIAVMGDSLMIFFDYGTLFSPLSARHSNLSAFTPSAGIYTASLWPLDADNLLSVSIENGKRILQKITFSDGYSRWTRTTLAENIASGILPCSDGVYVMTPEKIVTVSASGETASTAIPESLRGETLYFHDSPLTVYAGTGGLARYDCSENPPLTLIDRIEPDDHLTCGKIAFMTPSADGRRIYLSNLGPTSYNKAALGDGYDRPVQRVNVIEDGRVTDVTVASASADNPFVVPYLADYPDGAWLGSPGMAVEDPDKPGRYFCANGMEGIYVMDNGLETGKYNSLNAPMDTPWGNPGGRVMGLAIDRGGNLWAGSVPSAGADHRYEAIAVLPAEKRKADPSIVTAADWIRIPVDVYDNATKDIRILPCRHSGMVFIIRGGDNVICYDTRGTYSDFADDRYVVHESFTDQDGGHFDPVFYTCLSEDSRGRVWIGTSEGIIEIASPASALNADFRVNRIKVPRNDGTNLADYLLSSELIYAIAPDHSGRKWVATENSGVYLVSDTGREILSHFTADNSYLPSNEVYSAIADPMSNRVYFGTGGGLVSYSSTSSPAGADYGEITVYPNPVRPGYEGPVTVKGLMENSLVKIADSMGNVVFHTRSEGGMAVWDGCNESGVPVRSGVYYVMASQNNDGGSSGAVAKFVIIR